MPDLYFKVGRTYLPDLWALYFSGTEMDYGHCPPKEIIIQAQNEIVRLRVVGDMLAEAVRTGSDIDEAVSRWKAARNP